MNVEECFDRKILRKITPDKLKSSNSIKIAENKLLRAKELISHYAIYVYLNEKYSGKIDKGLIEAFRNYQLERHEIIYGFDKEITIERAESCIENASLFIKGVKNIL